MTLSEQIHKDMLDAVKSGEKNRVEVLKLALASLKNAKVEKGEELEKEEEEKVLWKELRKLQDAYEQYSEGGREDLAQREKEQLEIIQSYLPELMSEKEVRDFVEKKVSELGVDSPKDMGKVMGVVMKELSGKADGTLVSDIVKEVLDED